MATCPQDYYSAMESSATSYQKVCERCSINCTHCTGPSQYECTVCAEGFFLWNEESCIKHCPVGTYRHNSTKKCKTCPLTCLNCTSQNNCTTCISGYILTSTGTCTSTQTCSDTNCQYCDHSDNSICYYCQTDYLLFASSCVDICPSATYASEGICVRCQSGCSNCTGDGCNSCESSLYLHEGSCY